jgi:aminopeptidase N
LESGNVWPLSLQLGLHYPDRESVLTRVDLTGPTLRLSRFEGTECPNFIFANEEDYAYGRFLLDSRSRGTVIAELGEMHDLFRRTLLWGSLWESVRNAQLAPRTYLAIAVKLLPAESDETLARSLLSRSATALHRYVTPGARRQYVSQFESIAVDRLLHAPNPDLRIVWFRGLESVAQTPQGLARLKDILSGGLVVPGVELRALDRWNIITVLLAQSDPAAESMFAAEKQRDRSGDAQKYAYVAEAARPDPGTKQRYFKDFIGNPSRPEDWVEQTLYAFNYWNQPELTAPYLRMALQVLPQIKRERKIFFLVDWLTAFIDGQQSSSAQAEIYAYMKSSGIGEDLRLKILQAVDELDRTVSIRRKFPN